MIYPSNQMFARLHSYKIYLLGLFFSCIISSVAQAESRRVEFYLNSDGNSDFRLLMEQAESVSQASITQIFNENPHVSIVEVSILGQRNGSISPLLLATVSRNQWQRNNRIFRQTRYFKNSEILLGFLNRNLVAQSTPVTTFRAKPDLRDDPAFRDD